MDGLSAYEMHGSVNDNKNKSHCVYIHVLANLQNLIKELQKEKQCTFEKARLNRRGHFFTQYFYHNFDFTRCLPTGSVLVTFHKSRGQGGKAFSFSATLFCVVTNK